MPFRAIHYEVPYANIACATTFVETSDDSKLLVLTVSYSTLPSSHIQSMQSKPERRYELSYAMTATDCIRWHF